MAIAILVLAVLAALVSLDRLALWAERRGWIYYRTRKPGASGTVLSPLLDVLDPSHTYVVEEQERQRISGAETTTDQDVDPITGLPRP